MPHAQACSSSTALVAISASDGNAAGRGRSPTARRPSRRRGRLRRAPARRAQAPATRTYASRAASKDAKRAALYMALEPPRTTSRHRGDAARARPVRRRPASAHVRRRRRRAASAEDGRVRAAKAPSRPPWPPPAAYRTAARRRRCRCTRFVCPSTSPPALAPAALRVIRLLAPLSRRSWQTFRRSREKTRAARRRRTSVPRPTRCTRCEGLRRRRPPRLKITFFGQEGDLPRPSSRPAPNRAPFSASSARGDGGGAANLLCMRPWENVTTKHGVERRARRRN